MTLELVQQYWALLTASVVGLAVLLFVVWRAWQDSSRGRLGTALKLARQKRIVALRQRRAVDKATATLARLRGRSESVKPRLLQEAVEAVEDAEALLKIAGDQVLIAENHVRKIIVEEFPPKRHEALRDKYLGREEERGKPFTS